MKNENYITILGWMVNELKLKGNELFCYAIIYGFSQDGEHEFNGSSSYIAETLGITKPAVLDILKKLTEKDLIIKTENIANNVKSCTYKTNLETVKKLYWGDKESLSGGGKETLPNNNNIYNNNINNNNMSEFDNSDRLPLHFKELWNQLADSYKEQYPRNQKIPRITTGEIKNLYQRDKELKKFVKELISDGIITEKDIDGDIWHWALKQVWMRIQNNEFLRGECKPTEAHPKPFVLRADIFLRPSNFISMISPNNTKWDKQQGYGLKW